LLAPLTDLVGECGETKTTRRNGTKKKPFYWNESHQQAFDSIRTMIARDVVLAYPDFSEVYEIYTDASSRQLGAVITQKERPIAFSVGNYLQHNKSIPSQNWNYSPL